jgi:cytochrome c-type biogenesis protein CcmH/NrfF
MTAPRHSSYSLRLFAVAMLVSMAFALEGDSQRFASLGGKLHCTCGCGEILKECSHPKCGTRESLKHELADAIQQGQTDEQILEGMGTRHGASILLTPAFRGFNTLLWIVPIALSVIGFAFVLFGQLRSKRTKGTN